MRLASCTAMWRSGISSAMRTGSCMLLTLATRRLGISVSLKQVGAPSCGVSGTIWTWTTLDSAPTLVQLIAICAAPAVVPVVFSPSEPAQRHPPTARKVQTHCGQKISTPSRTISS
jgi:hypothetical protein